MLLDVYSTILWRCELSKTPHNGNFKKPVIIDLALNIINMTYTTFIFLKAVLNSNEHSKCEGQKQYKYE